MAIVTHIRKSVSNDVALLRDLYQRAFPDENLLPLLQSLLNEECNVLSLVATNDETVIGHAVFTICTVSPHKNSMVLLGPVAVLPDYQRQSIGSALINHGLQQLRTDGVIKMLVLGDPNYYQRFGFKEETDIAPAYPIPEEWKPAWQSLILNEANETISGKLLAPEPWQKTELWST